MGRFMCVAAAVLVAAVGGASASEAFPAVDGIYEDWAGIDPLWSDASGDGAAVDFGDVWVRSDAERVTLRFEIGAEMNLQGGNAITLFVDGDGDPTTGHSVEGLGAELAWTFGQRTGTVWTKNGERTVEQADIGLRQAPTVSSTQFEISFLRREGRGAGIAGSQHVAIVLVDEGRADGDRLPDEGALELELSNEPPEELLTVSLERRHPDDVRVVSFNVLFDGLFKRPAPFIRILRALDPDVICFQEIWAHSAQQAADQVSLALPDADWHGAATAEGHVVSRYPLREHGAIDRSGNYWALIDLPDDRYDVDLSVICAHPPCCDKEAERQEELDGIAAWMRELMTPGGVLMTPGGVLETPDAPPLEFDLAVGTPIVIAGDMNLVGGSRQVRTLLDGDIANEERFGPSRAPDWDGTPLADAWPRLAGGRDAFTWRDARSSFAPGKLDYIVYSDSVLELANAFVLATEELPREVLERYGLRADDTLDASDHLPVVADFTMSAAGDPTPAGEPVRTEAGE